MSLLELKDIVTELNESTEKINKKLIEYEDILKSISPGLICWIQDENDKRKFFGYYNFPSGWHLAIKVEDEIWEALKAPRYFRLAIFNRFDKIVEVLTETCKAFNSKMENSIEEKTNE